MKVPTFQKYGIKKSEVINKEIRETKISHLLTHSIPLTFGVCAGVVIYFIYYYQMGEVNVLNIIGNVFLFGSMGLLCVGIPMAILKLVERIWINFINPSTGKNPTITEYQTNRDDYEYWKVRMTEVYWRCLDGLSFENEVLALFKMEDYDVDEKFNNQLAFYFVMKKNDDKIFLAFKTNIHPIDDKFTHYIDKLSKHYNPLRTIIISNKQSSEDVKQFLNGSGTEFYSFREIAQYVRTLKK